MGGELAFRDAERVQLEARGVRTVTGEVARLVVEDDRLTGVEPADGRVIARPRGEATDAIPPGGVVPLYRVVGLADGANSEASISRVLSFGDDLYWTGRRCRCLTAMVVGLTGRWIGATKQGNRPAGRGADPGAIR
jgi:hypothetical protein